MNPGDILDDELKTLVVTIAALDFAKRETDGMRLLYPELDCAIEHALTTTQDVLIKASHAAETRRAAQTQVLGFHDEVE